MGAASWWPPGRCDRARVMIGRWREPQQARAWHIHVRAARARAALPSARARAETTTDSSRPHNDSKPLEHGALAGLGRFALRPHACGTAAHGVRTACSTACSTAVHTYTCGTRRSTAARTHRSTARSRPLPSCTDPSRRPPSSRSRWRPRHRPCTAAARCSRCWLRRPGGGMVIDRCVNWFWPACAACGHNEA